MNHGAPFTAQEDCYLEGHYQFLETSALAEQLGRTISSTQNRLRHLGLRKRPSDKPTQTKVSVFFDDDLMPKIRAGAESSGLSMSAYVMMVVRESLTRKRRKAA